MFPRSYMDFEQKYQKDPGMNRVKGIFFFAKKIFLCCGIAKCYMVDFMISQKNSTG